MDTQNHHEYARTRRIIGWSIAGLIWLIGIAIVASVLLRFVAPTTTTTSRFFPFGFFFFPIGFFFILFLFFAFGSFFRPWRYGAWRLGHRGYGYWHYRDEPREIARQRYARGEITKEQYEQLMRDLTPTTQ